MSPEEKEAKVRFFVTLGFCIVYVLFMFGGCNDDWTQDCDDQVVKQGITICRVNGWSPYQCETTGKYLGCHRERKAPSQD
jgi:hypothetical protein